MEYVYCKCYTNLDDYTCPLNKFLRVPMIGERVYVQYRGTATTLKVVGIIHDTNSDTPHILIELGK